MQPQQNLSILISNCETISGYVVTHHIGLVRGSTVRAKNFIKDWFAGLRNLIGGEITEYTRLQAEAREQALKRMILDAQNLRANAIINVRFETSMIMGGACEILAYGTAVMITPHTQGR